MNPRLTIACTLLVATAGMLAGCATGSTSTRLAAGQHPREARVRTERTATLGFQMFVPAEAATHPERRWPLIVFLHGAGERGTNLDLVTVHGPPKIVKARPDFPFLVASPQCPPDVLWDVDLLDAWLTGVLQAYPVDPQRVYLTGLSMGGNGTWAWATAHPERFAAAAPICGWGDTIRVWLASGPRREHLTKLPIWAFHGAKDNVVLPAESDAMVAAFGRIGNKVKLTSYPDAGHDAWTTTYDNPALYEWFLQHRRP